MKNIDTHANILRMDEILRKILGESFYDEIRTFFKKFILAEDIDRILITRRSYVLYKAFSMIFSVSTHDDDQKVREVLKKGTPRIYTSHSLPILMAQRENKSLLIGDDVIVNGRTILNVINKFRDKDDGWTFNVWCLRCNAEAARLNDLKPFLKHVIYVSPYAWERVSDKLTDAVVMANIGYVSFLQTYWITENLYNKILDNFVDGKISKYQINRTQKIITTNSKGNEQGFSLTCDYLLLGDEQHGNDFCAAMRLYKIEKSFLLIPYVFLPSLTSQELISLAVKQLNKNVGDFKSDIDAGTIQNEGQKAIIEYFANNWTAGELDDFPDIGIFFYQTLINYLSDAFLETILGELPKNDTDIAENMVLCFDSKESFPLQEERLKKLEALRNNMLVQYHQSSHHYENQLERAKDIAYCKNIFDSISKTNDGFLEAMKIYFTTMRKEDDIRAKINQNRLYGISVSDIVETAVRKKANCCFTDIAHYYLNLIYLWDTGLATCVILSCWNQDKNAIAYSEFIRHGEQAFRAIYSLYPNAYSILRRFSLITDSYDETGVRPFAQYCLEYIKDDDVYELYKKIEFQTFFTDCMSVSPKSVGANIEDDTIDKIIYGYRKWARLLNYKK